MSISGNQKAIMMKEKLNADFARKGVLTGLFSGCTWGLNSVLLGLALGLIPLMGDDAGKYALFAIPLAAACMNDSFAGLWLLLYNGGAGRFKEIIRSLKTFPGLMVCVAALLGGPIANGGYLLGISMAGPAYALTITALYPIVGALLSRIFLKQHIVPRVWVGMLLSVIGAIVISYVPPEGGNSETFYLGLLFASLAALGWGAEAVLAVFGMSMIDPKIAINIRELTSGLFLAIFVLPIVGGWVIVSQVFTLPGTLGAFAIAALAAAVSYLAWYKANTTIGVAKGMALNGTYVMWGVIFSVVFLNSPLTQNLVIGSGLVLIGATLVAINPKEFFKKGEVA
ncbi:DMT family transporter [Desulfosporosinus sp.]|uniref:DMT family transporter n=1 Tax=Desulfosporosinus sp. TaxID=157907 RepID=UPI000E962E97|nr:DMT family transporter [Desulfosporosinus sp.]MBC2722107.1 DMT family transporter [Desulfosporosinus sp.]MBC2726439.1 DMT family transporter [Desulfosporosinus sp.]HBV86799.1 EamA family transporter [Desulfosporosinus sp.]